MGLDQYLYARKYVGLQMEDQYKAIVSELNLEGLDRSASFPHLTVEICCASWRNNFAIDGFFDVACEGREFDDEVLVELLDRIEKTLAAYAAGDVALCEELLSPDGDYSFVGDVPVDQRYCDELLETKQQLTDLVGKDLAFVYRAG